MLKKVKNLGVECDAVLVVGEVQQTKDGGREIGDWEHHCLLNSVASNLETYDSVICCYIHRQINGPMHSLPKWTEKNMFYIICMFEIS